MTVIHINYVRTDDAWLKYDPKCPDCKKPAFCTVCFQEWYGIDVCCLVCGRRWADGEWLPLPFSRFARRNSVASAWRRYKTFKALPQPPEQSENE